MVSSRFYHMTCVVNIKRRNPRKIRKPPERPSRSDLETFQIALARKGGSESTFVRVWIPQRALATLKRLQIRIGVIRNFKRGKFRISCCFMFFGIIECMDPQLGIKFKKKKRFSAANRMIRQFNSQHKHPQAYPTHSSPS